MKIFILLIVIALSLTSFGQVHSSRASCGNPIPIQFDVVVTSNYNGANISCNGLCDGEITVSLVSGAGGPYGFEIFDGVSTYTQPADTPGGVTSTFINLCADNYNFTVIDSSQLIIANVYESCTETGVILNSPNSIGVNVLGFTDPTCGSICDGQIFTNVGGGTGTLTVYWPESGATVPSPNIACTGINTIQVTDVNGCFFDDVVMLGVQDTDAPTATAPSDYIIECAADIPAPDPMLIADEADNCTTIPIVTFESDVSDGNSCPEIITRTYRVTDDEGNYLDVYQSIIINDTQNPTASSPANVNVETFGDVPPQDVLEIIDESDNCTFSPLVQFVSDVSDGNSCPETITRTYSVTDDCGNSISVQQLITINDITNPTASAPGNINVATVNDVPVPDPLIIIDEADNSGNIPLVQFVSDVSDGNSCPEIITRTYSIIDACGNSTFVQQIITVNSPIVVSATTTNDNGTGNGGINISVSGGAAPYNYVWSNGAVTQDIQNVSAGTYDVDVTDTLGCSVNYVDSVLSACNIQVTPNVTPASCGQNNGAVTLSVAGGTAPYNIQWTNGSTGVTADSLYPGMYFANVLDANGCTAYGSVAVNSASGPQATANVLKPTCFNAMNGGINLTVTGGTAPYTYSWSNGKVTEDINNLQAGNYQVEIEDAAGCGYNLDVVVNQPAPLQAFVASNNAGCGLSNGGLAVTAQGGTGPYNFSWSNGPTTAINNNIPAGMYAVVVTDANGCVKMKTKSVNEAGAPIIMLDSTNSPSCGGLGAAFISAYGANPLTYNWSDGSTNQDLTGVNTGNYVVTVTGAGGCVSNMSVDIESQIPTMVDLCLIGVDSTTQTNLIVWEKPITQGIAYFNLYKESTVANQYFLETSVPYDSLSQYTDVNANPGQRSWRYRITTVDTCGMESEPSSIHKTMHLYVNQGQGNNYNLSWNSYEGITFGTYYINRYKPSEGWVTIDSVPSNINTYTDTNQPQNNVNYSLEIRLANNCTSTKYNHNTTRSNQAGGILAPGSGVGELDAMNNYSIYPNPVSDVINVTSLNGSMFTTALYDLSGARVWMESNLSSNKQMNMGDLPNGVYMLKIASGEVSSMHKVVVQR